VLYKLYEAQHLALWHRCGTWPSSRAAVRASLQPVCLYALRAPVRASSDRSCAYAALRKPAWDIRARRSRSLSTMPFCKLIHFKQQNPERKRFFWSRPVGAPEVENFENRSAFNPTPSRRQSGGVGSPEDVELMRSRSSRWRSRGWRGPVRGQRDVQAGRAGPPAAHGGADLDEVLPQVDLAAHHARRRDARPRAAAATTTGAAPAPPPAPAPTARVPAGVALSDDDGAADTAVCPQRSPWSRKTMAELYLKQGHPQEAVAGLSGAARAATNDARLKNKVEKLSSGGRKKSGVSAQAFLKGIWSDEARRARFRLRSTLPGDTRRAVPSSSRPHLARLGLWFDEVARRANVQSPEAPAPSVPPQMARLRPPWIQDGRLLVR